MMTSILEVGGGDQFAQVLRWLILGDSGHDSLNQADTFLLPLISRRILRNFKPEGDQKALTDVGARRGPCLFQLSSELTAEKGTRQVSALTLVTALSPR